MYSTSCILKYLAVYLVTCIIFIFFSCAGRGNWSSKIVWEDLNFSELPGQEDYPDEAAILLLDEGKMEIFGTNSQDGFSVYEEHRIYKILNHRGRRYANIVIGYSPSTIIENIYARTISPDGEITIIEKDDIYDVNLYPGFIFYSDQRAKIFAMPKITDGSIVEYKYTIRINSRTFRHSWHFQTDIPTLLSRFTLIKPATWEVDYHIYGIDIEPKTDEKPAGFKSALVWETKHLPPIKYEFGMPPINEISARLAFSPVGVKNWNDVAGWYFDLARPQFEAKKEVKKLVQNLTAGVVDDQEKLRRIYEWVRDNVRYIAVEIGIGSFKPYPAEEILNNRYGDCKDMSTLICSLGREAGLDVRTALISTWQNGIPDTSLPSPLHFNHAIVYCPTVGDSGIWMDATQKSCPFGSLPWFDQGLPALVVNEDGNGEILITPSVSMDMNKLKIDWYIALNTDGSATVKGKTSYWGAIATETRTSLYNASSYAIRKWIETYLAVKCAGATLDTFQVKGIFPVEDPVEIEYLFHSKMLATKHGDELILRPSMILKMNLADQFRSPSRIYPIRMPYQVSRELNLSVELKSDGIAHLNNRSETIDGEFGSGDWNWKMENNLVASRIAYQLFGKPILPQKFDNFQKFLDSISEKDLTDIIISLK